MSIFILSPKDEDEVTEHETKADPERLNQMVHPVAERLDILLSLLLSYIKDVCYVDGNNSYCLLNTYHAPGSVLGVFKHYLVLIKIL